MLMCYDLLGPHSLPGLNCGGAQGLARHASPTQTMTAHPRTKSQEMLKQTWLQHNQNRPCRRCCCCCQAAERANLTSGRSSPVRRTMQCQPLQQGTQAGSRHPRPRAIWMGDTLGLLDSGCRHQVRPCIGTPLPSPIGNPACPSATCMAAVVGCANGAPAPTIMPSGMAPGCWWSMPGTAMP
jgi:hypothetical protein